MTPRHVRVLRGAAAAWVATVVAATAHTLAGGGAPSPALVAATGILATPFAVALAGRSLSAWRIAATVLAAQALFHVSFALTAGTDAASGPVHGHHVALSGGGALAASVVPDEAMLAGHLVASAVTVIALIRGERMLRALGRGIRSLFSQLSAIAPRPAVADAIRTPTRVTRVFGRVVLSGLSRRGPPTLVTAAL